MNTLGPQISAALFTDQEKAEEAWGILADGGIPAAIVTDPGILGKFELALMVARDDLDKAQALLGDLIVLPNE
jgi:hypothetical protein